MHKITHFMIVIAGIVGIAACNPNSVAAQSQTDKTGIVHASLTQETTSNAPENSVNIQNVHVIEIHKMKFATQMLDVNIGDKITWINKDIVPHSATAKDKSWDSGQLKKGESFSLIITNEIQLDYFCLYHRQMKAELVLGTKG